MTYTFARVGAVVALNVEDYYSQKKRWWLRLSEKTARSMRCPAIISSNSSSMRIFRRPTSRKTARAAVPRRHRENQTARARADVAQGCVVHGAPSCGWRGIETPIGCRTFRATGITDYLTNGGRIEVAQKMAGHSNAKTTGLYDRRNDDISVVEVERIGIWSGDVNASNQNKPNPLLEWSLTDLSNPAVDRTALAVRKRMLTEIVNRIDVGSVNLPRHLVGFAVHYGTPEVVRVVVHHFVESSGCRKWRNPYRTGNEKINFRQIGCRIFIRP
jgi:hypothetical protein